MPLGRRPILLLLNGVIHTMEPGQPIVSALAIDRGSGRILAAGDASDLREYAGPLTDTLDLGGRVALPGLIDAHTHLLGYAMGRLEVELRDTRSEDEAVALVKARVDAQAPGTWIVGHSWDKNAWRPERFPTKASLDAIAPEHPVMLASHDYHSVWVNSEAMRRAGVDATTADPGSGRIERDSAGEPTGMFFENGAIEMIERAITPPSDETLAAELRAVFAELRSRGVTGVHNIEAEQSLRLMQRLRAEGEIGPRVLLYIRREALPAALGLGLQAGFGDDFLRFAGVKVYMDGALGSQTAAMLDPYEGSAGKLGLLTTGDEEIERVVRESAEGGVGMAIHAIGDRAVKTALDGIEAGRKAGTLPARRIRLEHVQLARMEDLQRMARLGVVASIQPFHAVVDRYTAERYWGDRYRRAYAYRTMGELGVRVAFGSDTPVDTCDPLRILHAAINRYDDRTPDAGAWLPDQALTMSQALYAYTAGAAYAGGQEQHQGSLAPGKLADIAVLAEDPFTLPKERIAGAQVAATLIGGELVHGALE
ncbi:MAG TPA: amidohydrolase [Ktedonobacterales bacterium]|nr:amidohydrolase [Ktedonobacterales bacterium]